MSAYDQHFARLAQRYDTLRREATDEQADRLIAAGGLRSGQALVDIGCGTGAMTALLVRRAGVDATGVDPSEAMLGVARSRESARCRFVQGRAEALPFEPGSFDRALMKLVIHLVERPRAFAQARRVLRDGGALLVSTIDPDGFEVTPVWRHAAIPREHALEMIRGRFASSFTHIDDEEYESGLARAERDMPATVRSDLKVVDLRCDTR